MNQKALPIGIDDFRKIRKNQYYYIDKTLLIRELLDMKGEVNLFTRPRRFGKTLNMSMLRCFFENGAEDNRELFKDTKIMDAGEPYLVHMGKYPVISISLKSLKQPTFELAFDQLKRVLKKEYDRHWWRIQDSGQVSANEKMRYEKIMNLEGEEADYYIALEFLSECLHRCYGRKAIILIDEYDVPLENAYFSGFYEKMIMLIRSLFESALKTNPNLEFAVITGCLRISKEPIFTGLNNLKIMSVTTQAYEHFGFTQEEVDKLLAYYQLQEKEATVKKWYDGYLFGKVEVYNPWSVINYVEACRQDTDVLPAPYWSNTSSNSIVRSLIERADMSARQEIEALIEGKTIIKPIHEDITYEDIGSTQDNLWNFLFFTGYLKKIHEKMEEEILSENLMETISFYDYQENFYHGFLVGMLKNIGSYIVLSNRESGNGRPDILVKYPSVRGKAVILELKVADSYAELEKACEEALRQIETQQYEDGVRSEGYQNIIKYGVAFYRKECMVKIGVPGSKDEFL